jgi:hypothetical protein
MKLKRRQGPRTVWRAMIFPVYLILQIERGEDLPTPLLSRRDGRYGCHVEPTMAEAMATVRELQTLRQRHRDWYPEVVGNAVAEVPSPTALRQLADGMTPTPAGFFYNIRINLRRQEWEAVFVPWEKLQAYQRAMG